jgi:hypothetical protein
MTIESVRSNYGCTHAGVSSLSETRNSVKSSLAKTSKNITDWVIELLGRSEGRNVYSHSGLIV